MQIYFCNAYKQEVLKDRNYHNVYHIKNEQC